MTVSHVDFVTLRIERGDGVDTRYASLLEHSGFPQRLKTLKRIFLLARILRDSKESVIHFHYARWFYFLLVPTLKRIGKPAAATVYGSDYYRISGWQRWLQYRFFNVLDAVSFTNEATMVSLTKNAASLRAKRFITRFGLTPLEAIDRCRDTDRATMFRALDIPEFPLIIACGYNANPGQQHFKMIAALRRMPASMREKTLFLFPMTYGGSDDYRQKVKDALANSGLHWKILTNFLEGDRNAYVRLLPDIMINMLVTDQLSGSMQEHLYAGNGVIAGAWLPYDIFIQRGILMDRAASFDVLPEILENMINDLPAVKEKVAKNRDIIRTLSSWETVMPDWKKFYQYLTGKQL